MKKINHFDQFGLKDFYYLSCSHRLGFDQLKKFISKYKNDKLENIQIDYSISVYGKPNAGKSTLLNQILG